MYFRCPNIEAHKGISNAFFLVWLPVTLIESNSCVYSVVLQGFSPLVQFSVLLFL